MRRGVCILVVFLASQASAGDWWEKLQGHADLKLGVRYEQRFSEQPASPWWFSTAGFSMRFAAYRGPVGLSVLGLDLWYGGGPGGFGYQSDLFPLGIALKAGNVFHLGVTPGIGTEGITSNVDAAFSTPVIAWLHLRLKPVQLSAHVISRWNHGSASRDVGHLNGPFADEWTAQFTVRIGRSAGGFRARWANGYFVGARYREWQQSQYWGIVIGHGIDTQYVGRRKARPARMPVHRPEKKR